MITGAHPNPVYVTNTIYFNGTIPEEQNIFNLMGHTKRNSIQPSVKVFAINPLNKPLKLFFASRFTKVKHSLKTAVAKNAIDNNVASSTLIQNIKLCVMAASTSKTIKCNNTIFNPKNLIQPLDNPNNINKKAWSLYYQAVNKLKTNTTRDTRAEISPTEFHKKQQQKLLDMSPTNSTISHQYIDEICGNARKSKVCLHTTTEEVTDIIKSLNPSKAYDAYDIST